MTIINMQSMRYINILDKISRVKTRKCFVYNNILFFAVEGKQVSRAIGTSASNIKKIQDQIGKKVKIISEPRDSRDITRFIENIVFPIRFKSLEIRDNAALITAGSNQNKAALIGRNKRRLEELAKIVNDFFNLDLKII